jgi:hypothetical protein
MGFKLPGKSIQTGTSGHSSALKMVAEQKAASALKMQASPAKSPEYDKAAKKDSELGNYVAERKKIKAKYGGDRKKYRASEEYKANQNKINKAYGIDDGYVAPAATTTTTTPEVKTEVKPTKKEKKVTKIHAKLDKNDERWNEREGESSENRKVRDAKSDRKEFNEDAKSEKKFYKKQGNLSVKLARTKHGKGSDEVKEAKDLRKSYNTNAKINKKHEKVTGKLNVLAAKKDDMEGEYGGKRAKGVIGNIRKGINKRRTKRTQKKLDKIQNKMYGINE